MFILLQCHGDIEKYSGSRKLQSAIGILMLIYLLIISQNVFNCICQSVYLKAYISMYRHDFICLSKTHLHSIVPDSLLEIDGYSLVRADQPNDTKRSGVCIYYKDSLPVRVINLSYFEKALLSEMTYHNEDVIVSVIYRSTSESNNEFDSFLPNLKKLVNDINNGKPALSIIRSDFNTRSQSWWSNDINTTTERSKLPTLSFSNGFSQLINEPIHIQTNSSSCIDLIFNFYR